MHTTNVENFNPMHQVIEDFIRARVPTSGTTQKDQARANGVHQGRIEYMSEALALLLTAERVKMMEPILVAKKRKWVEIVPGYQVRVYLQKLRDRWDHKEFDGMEDLAFHIAVQGELNELFLGGEWYDKSYEPQRKGAVRDGIIEPDKSDKEWIAEELAAFEAAATPLRMLAAKVNGGETA